MHRPRRRRRGQWLCCILTLLLVWNEIVSGPTDEDYAAMEKCGISWSEYYPAMLANEDIFLWTVAGGDDYRHWGPSLLYHWSTLGLHPVLVVGLDWATTQRFCTAGYMAVHWDAPSTASYSRVADAKFTIAAQLAPRKAMFIELDVVCRENPLPLFRAVQERTDADLGTSWDMAMSPIIPILVFGIRLAMWRPSFQGCRAFFRTAVFIATTPMCKAANASFLIKMYIFTVRICSAMQQLKSDGASLPMYEISDHQRRHNLLNHCAPVRETAFLPSGSIAAHSPPTVYENTLCIHPLMDKPFVPLVYKIAVAQWLHFLPPPKQRRYLKLEMGDLSYHDRYEDSFSSEQFFCQ